MSRLKKSSCLAGFLALIGGLTGCGPSKTSHFLGSFLPPEPKALSSVAATPEPPRLPPTEPRVHLKVGSKLPGLHGQPEFPLSRAATAIREAEWHFQAGKKHYSEGNEEGARQEFDRAVDILLGAPGDLSPAERARLDQKLDEMVVAIHRYDLAGLGAGEVAEEPGFERSPLEDIPPMTFPIDPALKNKVVEEIRATVSQLPLQANDAVLGYIHYFSSERGRRILVSGLRRAGRYRPLIQRILDEEGVPQELIHVAQAESGFLPRAVSRKRATGMWQFMKPRGNQYGLTQTAYTDDRLDPEKATRAAARHLRDLYHEFGDWYLALAAYNSGPGTIERAVERTGYADFWELRQRNVLPKETSNYVPIILAMTIMVKNAREYGLEGLETDPPLEYDTIEITAPTNLMLVADLAECPLSQIRELNPSLLKNLAPAGYMLRVPKGTSQTLIAALESVPPERRNAWRMHRVSEGETIAAIAQRYRLSERSILQVNQAFSGDLETGDLLLIPAAAESKKTVVRRTSTSNPRARKATATKAASARRTASHRTASTKHVSTYTTASLERAKTRRTTVRR